MSTLIFIVGLGIVTSVAMLLLLVLANWIDGRVP
jgi:hypothetical protein